jgi:hypothetical protein
VSITLEPCNVKHIQIALAPAEVEMTRAHEKYTDETPLLAFPYLYNLIIIFEERSHCKDVNTEEDVVYLSLEGVGLQSASYSGADLTTLRQFPKIRVHRMAL